MNTETAETTNAPIVTPAIAALLAERLTIPDHGEREVTARTAIREAYALSKRGFRTVFVTAGAFHVVFQSSRTGAWTHRAQASYWATDKKGSKTAVTAGFAAAGDELVTLRFTNDHAIREIAKKLQALGWRGYIG